MAPPPDARESIDRRLVRRYLSHGDVAARDRLVARWQPALRSFVRPYRDRGQPAEDLMQVANVGLVKALDRFDPTRAGRLMSFVAPTVQGEIKRHFRDHTRPVHVPRSAQELHARVLAGADARAGAGPGALRALAADVGLDGDQIDVVLRTDRAFNARSIDAPAGGDADGALLDDALGRPDAGYDRVDDRTVLESVCRAARLGAGDREILRMRIEDDLLQREIAQRVGVSQMQVSRRLAVIASALDDARRRGARGAGRSEGR